MMRSTPTRRNDKPRKWMLVALCAALAAAALAAPPAATAAQQQECDPYCWAVLAYLRDQGLSREDVIALGNSGLAPDPNTPQIVPDPESEKGYILIPTRPHLLIVTQPQTIQTHTSTWDTTWADVAYDRLEAEVGAEALPDAPADDSTYIDIETLLDALEDQPDFDTDSALLGVPDGLADDSVTRGEMALVLCAGLGGCAQTSDIGDIIKHIAAQGFTAGSAGVCRTSPDSQSCVNDFNASGTMSNAQLVTFMERLLGNAGTAATVHATPGHIPQGGHAPAPAGTPQDPLCSLGLIIVQGYATPVDDGCRPYDCAHGRDAAGWCLAPAPPPQSVPLNLRLECVDHGATLALTGTWDPPAVGASGYQSQISDYPTPWAGTDIAVTAGPAVTATATTPTAPGTFWLHVQPYGIPGVGAGQTASTQNTACRTPLPVYAAPPPAPECPDGWHEHGFNCNPDHIVPTVCGSTAHQYVIHHQLIPDGHQTLTYPACVPAPDVCSVGFHAHTSECVPTHHDPPSPCQANRRLVWQNTTHGTSEVLACPNPVVDSSLLVNTAGKDLILRLSVDVTSGHVEPSRTFTITAADDTAANGTHYSMTHTVVTFDAANQTHEILISTTAQQNHGINPRTFAITVADNHPPRGHVSVPAIATINPPAIEHQ